MKTGFSVAIFVRDVCPWNNKFARAAISKEFQSTENKEINFEEVKQLTNNLFKKKYFESPILRTGLKGQKRNAEFSESGNYKNSLDESL